MAEAAAALYAVETAAEGAALGAFAVSRATAPLHIRFYRLPSPNKLLTRSSHTLNIVSGHAYIYGGDVEEHASDEHVHAITLPSDLALKDIDHQAIPPKAAPERSLAPYSDDKSSQQVSTAEKNSSPSPRAAHASTSIDNSIFIFGGRAPIANSAASPSSPSITPLDESGTIHAFDTNTHTWSTLTPQPTKCSSGVPCPRTYASAFSTTHPMSSGDHGTIFLHGGYDGAGKLLRDVWTFDVSSRVWSRWPDVPHPGPQDIAGEARIVCTGSRLWRVGDGFGKVVYLDIVRDDVNDFSGSSEMGVSPKTGNWETVEFAPIPVSGEGSEEERIEAKMGRPGMNVAAAYPSPRQGAGLVPITTGAGREYLLYFMGKEGEGSTMADVWSFQIRSEQKTPANLKDRIREMVGYSSGEDTWARADVVESTKDGPEDLPRGLSRFGCDSWHDLGSGGTLIWGGVQQGGQTTGDGWVMVAE